MVVQDEGWAVLCSFTNQRQDMNQNYDISQVEPRNCRNSSLYIPSSRLNFHSVFLWYYTYRQHPELSQHHLTCTKQRLSFENTPDNLQNVARPLSASFRYLQLYYNANAWNVDSFSTGSNGTEGKPQRNAEGNC